LSDCEELVGFLTGDDGVGLWLEEKVEDSGMMDTYMDT